MKEFLEIASGNLPLQCIIVVSIFSHFAVWQKPIQCKSIYGCFMNTVFYLITWVLYLVMLAGHLPGCQNQFNWQFVNGEHCVFAFLMWKYCSWVIYLDTPIQLHLRNTQRTAMIPLLVGHIRKKPERDMISLQIQAAYWTHSQMTQQK